MTDFAESFNRLSQRFESIQAENQEDGERYLRNVSAHAATTTKLAIDTGVLTGMDIDIQRPEATMPDESQEPLWAMAWYGICTLVAREHRGQLPNLHLSRRAGDGHIVRAKDWRERGHNYAAVCRLLADLCRGPKTAFLGITLGDRTVSRSVDGATLGPVEFGNKARPWKLLAMLVEAGADGTPNGEFDDEFEGGQYVHKSTLLTMICPLRLNVHTDGGTWKLVHLP